jgi:hypothetical protein
VGTRGPCGRVAAVGAEGFGVAAVSAAGHWSLGGKGGRCDIDIVRVLRIGDGDTGVLERNDGTAGVADRWVDEAAGVEIRGGTLDAERERDVGATDAERIGPVGATDPERLCRRASGETILGR